MKCLLIYNQKSGKQNVVKNIDRIVSMLKTKYEVVDKKASFYDGETRDMAKEACGKYDTIVVAGGDGTLHEVICGIGGEKQRPRIGIIPAGTINDVSKSLKISRGYKKAVQTILDGRVISHDLFKINEEYGIYASAMGLLSGIGYEVNSKPKKIFGKLAYYFSIPKFLFGKKSIDIDLDVNDKQIKEKCSLFLVLNSRSVAGRKVDKKNDVSDGEVKIIIFPSKKKRIKLREIVKIVMFFGFGIRKNTKKYQIITTNKFNLKLNKAKDLCVDGEKMNCDTYNFEMVSPGVEIFY